MANEDLERELAQWRENTPNALMGAALIPTGVGDLNELFFKTEDTVRRMFEQLIEAKLWLELPGDTVTNFMGYGFPRTIPSITALDAVLVKLERNASAAGLLRVEFVFIFKGDSRIVYTTAFIA